MQPSATSKQISNYLGHRADAEGLHTTAVKVEALLKAPVPTNVQEIHSFLGLINYVYVCMHITNYVASDPCFRSASACIGC